MLSNYEFIFFAISAKQCTGGSICKNYFVLYLTIYLTWICFEILHIIINKGEFI